jgi:ribosomal protein L11 methyltransferase
VPRVTELRVPASDAELAADRLWSAGAQAVEEAEGPGATAILRTVLAADDEVSQARLGHLPDGWEVGFCDQPDAPAETWRRFAVPIEVSPTLTIRPAWVAAAAPSQSGRLEIAIEPGGAFGLGNHPTTRLSAAAVERLTGEGSGVASVLDVGCGSGVLAIIAAARGATRVIAIDVAEAAREATAANAAANGVGDRVVASTDALEQIDGAFDLVLANILAPTLIALAAELQRVLPLHGVLVLSGVLDRGYDHVVAALAPLRLVRTDLLDGWAALELRR